MTTWIVTSTPEVSALLAAAHALGGPVKAVVIGSLNLAGVDEIVSVPAAPGVPVEALAPAVAAAVQASGQDVVLLPNRRAERSLAGAIAAKLAAPVLTDVTEFSDQLLLSRFGGIVLEAVEVAGPVVVVIGGGAELEAGSAPVTETSAAGAYPVAITGEEQVPGALANLAAAKRVVAVGRGFRAEQDLDLARELAAKIDAVLVCSRPLAEGMAWMPKESYVGVSGVHIKPQLYIAIGISGQLHHTAGVDAEQVVVINDDPDAPFFKEADYGIVGDLYAVLPALTAAVK